MGCRLDWAGDWATRCEKESKLHPFNSFITLTYSEENVPWALKPTVDKRDFQLFMKRLRKEFGDGIRYFASGEYGDKTFRPHYHALLFNLDFPDKRLWRQVRGSTLYLSKSLDELWGLGFTSIGAVNFSTASYVARYVLKKLTGPARLHGQADPFVLMSRNPGLGSAWYDKFKNDVYPDGSILVGEARIRRPPPYFDRKWAKENWRGFMRLKAKRRLHAIKNISKSLPSALYAKQVITQQKVSQLKREI